MTKYKGDFASRLRKAEMDAKALHWLEMMESSESGEFWQSEYEKLLKLKEKELIESLDTADYYSKRWNYNRIIVEIAQKLLLDIEIPVYCTVAVTQTRAGQDARILGQTIPGNKTKDGVVLVLKTGSKYFYNAFWTVGNAEIDIGALNHILLRLENTIDALGGKLEGHSWTQQEKN